MIAYAASQLNKHKGSMLEQNHQICFQIIEGSLNVIFDGCVLTLHGLHCIANMRTSPYGRVHF